MHMGREEQAEAGPKTGAQAQPHTLAYDRRAKRTDA